MFRTIWREGEPIILDLPSGSYRFTFSNLPAKTVKTFWSFFKYALTNEYFDKVLGYRVKIYNAEIVHAGTDEHVKTNKGEPVLNNGKFYDCRMYVLVAGIPWGVLVTVLTFLLGLGMVVWLNLTKIEEIISSPAGAAMGVMSNLVLIGIVGIVLFYLISRGKNV